MAHAQATVVGQPVQGVVIQPPNQPGDQRQYDGNSAGIGWALYAVGCLVCFCCGGFPGIIFWLVIVCLHFCKPADERKNYPQERIVAQVSLLTACFCTIVTVMIIVAWVVLIAKASDSVEDINALATCSQTCGSSFVGTWLYVCQAADGVCDTASLSSDECEITGGRKCRQQLECPRSCTEAGVIVGSTVCQRKFDSFTTCEMGHCENTMEKTCVAKAP